MHPRFGVHMFNFSNSFKNSFYRASTIFSSGFGSASLSMWAMRNFATDFSDGQLLSVTGSIVAGMAALAGAGCAHAYFVGGDDKVKDYEAAIRMDPITGVLSRAGLENEIPKLLERNKKNNALGRVSLISVDFDELKDINEAYGQETGNAVLNVIAKRLEELVGSAGIFGRTNGSEFIIALQSGPDNRELRAAAAAIMERLSRPIKIGAVNCPVYAIGGVIEAYPKNTEFEKVVRNANLARNIAKKSARGCYAIYHPEMRHQAEYRQWLETELAYAMQRNEFALHYQPQVHAPTGNIVGYEALVRWNHRDKGAISPDEFIAVAESCGLIQQLGTWVLRRACFDAVKLPSNIKMSVNVSTVQMDQLDFLETLRTALAESGLPASRLELEVTESVLIRDHARMRKMFSAIHDLGVAIAIDDFGTGYSNLTNLSELTFDKIKIDKSFVDQLGSNSGHMIATIVNLAHSFDAAVIAEGIETTDQVEVLTAAGCQLMQGYLYGRPAAISHLTHEEALVAA